MRSMEQIVSDFIGGAYEADTNTGNYQREQKYIEWLISNELGDDYNDDDLQELFEQKYCQGYNLDKFNADNPVVTMETKIVIDGDGKTYNAAELLYHTGEIVEYEGDKYILVRQASPDNVLGEDTPCYSAPAIRIGDSVDMDGWVDRYTVVWKVLDDYDPECGDESLACDWGDPYDVFPVQSGQYNIAEGRFY